MIKLESAHIEEVRGIRKLDIDFRKEKYASRNLPFFLQPRGET